MSSANVRNFVHRQLRHVVDTARSGYAWVTLGMLGRSGLQAVLVVILARSLGTIEYGLIVAIASITSIVAVFSGLGATTLHLRDLSIDGIDPNASFTSTMRRNVATLPPLIAVAGVIAWALYGSHAYLLPIALLATGDILAFSMSDVLQRTMQGSRRFKEMALFMVLVPGIRCVLLTFLLSNGNLSIVTWSVVCLSSGALPFLVALLHWRQKLTTARGKPHPDHRLMEGLGFAVAAGSTRTHADSDKAIVAGFSTLSAAGQYSVAYRFFDVLMLPILSYIEWRMSALFRTGASVRGGSAIRANRGFIASVGSMGIIASIASLGLAGVLPLILGRAYAESANMVSWLALLPITSSAWWIFRTLLATTGKQIIGGTIELSAAVFNVGLTIGLVIPFGWKGAVAGTYATHVLMSMAAAAHLVKESRRRP